MVLPKLQRGQNWEANFELQTHKQELSKSGRPALIIQTNIVNDAGHATTTVIPCTTQTYRDGQGDGFPLRVALGKLGKLTHETDVLVDQIRTISNQRLMGNKPIADLSRTHLKRVEDALKILMVV